MTKVDFIVLLTSSGVRISFKQPGCHQSLDDRLEEGLVVGLVEGYIKGLLDGGFLKDFW